MNNIKNSIFFLALIVALVLGLLYYFSKNISNPSQETATTTSPEENYDSIGNTQEVSGVSLTPLEVKEDSRCPQDVQCVWAGTVKVNTRIVTPTKSTVEVLEIGKGFDTGSELITLTTLTPAKTSGVQLKPSDYHFTFLVTPKLTQKQN